MENKYSVIIDIYNQLMDICIIQEKEYMLYLYHTKQIGNIKDIKIKDDFDYE